MPRNGSPVSWMQGSVPGLPSTCTGPQDIPSLGIWQGIRATAAWTGHAVPDGDEQHVQQKWRGHHSVVADLQLLSPPPVEMLGSLLTVSGTLTFSGKIVTAYYLGVSHYLTNGLIKY